MLGPLFLIAIVFVICLGLIFYSSFSLDAAYSTIDSFFMIMKLQEDKNDINPGVYMVTDINTSLNNIGGNKIEYDLHKGRLWIDDYAINMNSFPYNVIDTNTPNVVKTRNGAMTLLQDEGTFERQMNTLTNITSYKATSTLAFEDQTSIDDVNITAVIYPNGTGVLELRQP